MTDKKLVIISYDKTETGVKIEIANEYWELFQQVVIKGAEEYQIIFEDKANPVEKIDSNFKQI